MGIKKNINVKFHFQNLNPLRRTYEKKRKWQDIRIVRMKEMQQSCRCFAAKK